MAGLSAGHGDSFVEVYRAANHAELIAIRLELDAREVRYYVKNEFASLGSLSAVGGNEMSVMVEASRAPECWQAIRDAVGPGGSDQTEPG
jgi:hypothetical protein